MGALGASSNRASTFVKVAPLPVPVDEDAPLIQNAIQKERRAFLDPPQKGDVNSATGDLHQAGGQRARPERSLASGRYQQVEVGASVLVAPRERAI